MFKLRLAILGATAALALGTAGALAMEAAGTNNDSHGDAVASAARNCPHGPNGVHGECVSDIAQTNSNDTSDSDTNGRASAPGQVCKAPDATEANEPTSKAADKTEDRAEQQAFVACVTAHAAAKPDTGS
jgi:hypothetical protein